MAYKNVFQVDDTGLFRGMRKAAQHGMLVLVHAENGDVEAQIRRELLAAHMTEPRWHAVSRPPEIEGEATRVDRDILEKLEAPLTHLLRNALDHGLEKPAARLAAGKAPEGLLKLSARHVSGVLEIVVEDDGGGINVERVRQQVATLRGFVCNTLPCPLHFLQGLVM